MQINIDTDKIKSKLTPKNIGVAVVALVLVITLISVLAQCGGSSNIKSVTISGKTYSSIYLYEVDAECMRNGQNVLEDYDYYITDWEFEEGATSTRTGSTIFPVPEVDTGDYRTNVLYTILKKR